MNKETLYESRFQQIFNYNAKTGLNEMTLLSGMANEEDNNQDVESPNTDSAGGTSTPDMGGDPNAMGGTATPPMGGDPNAMGGAAVPPMGGGGPNAMGGIPNTGGEEVTPPEGFNPTDMGGDPNAMGGVPEGNTEQPGDEVLDVTELTDSQENIEDEIKSIGGKFDKVLTAVGAFEELLRRNDEKIEDLKAEFEKRNPTQIEKLSMQTAKSGPFNVTPKEFWDEKEATSNYSTENDDNGKEQGQYVITANDVNGDTNWKAIADSLDGDDFMYHQTLNKILGM